VPTRLAAQVGVGTAEQLHFRTSDTAAAFAHPTALSGQMKKTR
jgi:hypothetical protein